MIGLRCRTLDGIGLLALSLLAAGCGDDSNRSVVASPEPIAERRAQVPWTLEGTRDGGGALRIRSSWGDSGCETYDATAIETLRQVEISVVRDQAKCGEAISAVANLPPRITVRLATPLNGRKVAGPLRVLADAASFNAPVVAGEGVEPQPFEVPSLVGLDLSDARDVAKRFSTRVALTSSSARSGRVLTQRPRAGRHRSAKRVVVQVTLGRRFG